METLAKALCPGPGVISVTGSGGKTSLLKVLSEELSGTKILCTTTHILPFAGIPLYTGQDPAGIRRMLTERPCLQAGILEPETGKLTAPAIPIELLSHLADTVLVEADGARHFPLKAHLENEPVIPSCSDRILQIIGISGIGQSIPAACHRPELFEKRAGLSLSDSVTEEALLRVLMAEHLPADAILLNGVRSDDDLAKAERLSFLLHAAFPGIRVFACCLPLPGDSNRRVSYREL